VLLEIWDENLVSCWFYGKNCISEHDLTKIFHRLRPLSLLPPAKMEALELLLMRNCQHISRRPTLSASNHLHQVHTYIYFTVADVKRNMLQSETILNFCCNFDYRSLEHDQ